MQETKIIPITDGQAVDLEQDTFDAWSEISAAASKIAPVWPLQNFVAVNPYIGLTGNRWIEAAAELSATAQASSSMTPDFYRKQLETGRMTVADIEEALENLGSQMSPSDLLSTLDKNEGEPKALPLMSDLYCRHSGIEASEIILEQMSKWCADYFDQGQAAVTATSKQDELFASWLEHQSIDKTLPILGLSDFHEILSELANDPRHACKKMLFNLGLDREIVPLYLHRLARSVGGWIAYARYLDWGAQLDNRSSDVAATLLTVRLAYDWYCFQSQAKIMGPEILRQNFRWQYPLTATTEPSPLIYLQEAYENAARRKTLSLFRETPKPSHAYRKDLQAAFCIDVRSEVYRRALEAQSTGIETIGFAGFFGLATDVRHFGDTRQNAHCPVLLKPGYQAQELPAYAEAQKAADTQSAVAANWFSFRAFKSSAVSSFAFVEALGLSYLVRTITDALRITRPASLANTRGLIGMESADDLRYELTAPDGTALSLEQKVDLASGILAGMGLKKDFARLVILVGHGSNSVNNPHAAGLDCGACGGNSGTPNAQLTADLLNRADVRHGLERRGLYIPSDSWFVAALHDTTTDEVSFLGTELVPDDHRVELDTARRHFDAATTLTRAEREKRLNIISTKTLEAELRARSRDWSEVRPEWGLAGCKAFVAAPRSHSSHTSLDGQAFLHSYEYEYDADFKTLELIMTAPMIVASWINLQYFGSTVDNAVFGSGNKTLHNVVGKLGVLEGNGGDLRVGLPMQSLHDGENWMHDPVKLSVIIRAPINAMNDVVNRHEMVRDLADNGWLHLYAMSDLGAISHQYTGGCQWIELDSRNAAKARTVA